MPVFQKLKHEIMSFRGDFPCCLCIQHILEQQQLFMKMRDGALQVSSVPSAESKCSCDADCADGVQPVRVLNNLPLNRFRLPVPVFAD